MQQYYGTKKVSATPKKKEFSRQISENPPRGEVYEQDGYEVVYEDGYTSWSPKEVFESAYQPINTLSFGHAIVALKSKQKVARSGWNGKGMWLELFVSEGGMYKSRPLADHIMMATACGKFVPWLASQTDVLADDWMIVE